MRWISATTSSSRWKNPRCSAVPPRWSRPTSAFTPNRRSRAPRSPPRARWSTPRYWYSCSISCCPPSCSASDLPSFFVEELNHVRSRSPSRIRRRRLPAARAGVAAGAGAGVDQWEVQLRPAHLSAEGALHQPRPAAHVGAGEDRRRRGRQCGRYSAGPRKIRCHRDPGHRRSLQRPACRYLGGHPDRRIARRKLRRVATRRRSGVPEARRGDRFHHASRRPDPDGRQVHIRRRRQTRGCNRQRQRRHPAPHGTHSMKRTLLSFVIASAIVAGTGLAATPPASATVTAPAAQDSPSQLVLDNSQRVLSTLEKRRAEFTKDRGALRQFVSSEFSRMFDRDYAARQVLGRHARGADDADVKLFADALADNLMQRYGSSLLDFNTQLRVRVKSGTALTRGLGVRVSSEILRSGGEPIPVDYLMRQSGGTWKVFDVMVEGVSFVQTFRQQFDNELTHKSIRQVAADLRNGQLQADAKR